MNRTSSQRALQTRPISSPTLRRPTMSAFVAPTPPLRLSSGSTAALRGQFCRNRALAPLRRARAPRATLETLQTLSTFPPATLSPLSLPPVSLASTTPLLQFAKLLAGPGINIFNFAMIVRIILSWYPKADLAKAPWIYVAVPTEPLLRATREVIKPVGGVDISPIVWFALMSLVHELLVGPQGILVLLELK